MKMSQPRVLQVASYLLLGILYIVSCQCNCLRVKHLMKYRHFLSCQRDAGAGASVAEAYNH